MFLQLNLDYIFIFKYGLYKENKQLPKELLIEKKNYQKNLDMGIYHSNHPGINLTLQVEAWLPTFFSL